MSPRSNGSPRDAADEGLATDPGSEHVFRGALWSAAALAASVFLGLPLTVALVRLLPHEQYGNLALGTAIAGLLGAVGGLGLSAAVSRQASHALASGGDAAAHGVFRAGSRIALVAGALIATASFGLAAILLSVHHLRPAIPVLLVLTPAIAIGPSLAVAGGYLQARRRPARAEFSRIVTSALTFTLSIFALLVGVRQASIFAGFRTLGAIAGLILLVLGARRFMQAPEAEGETRHGRDLLRFSIPLLLTSFMWTAIAQLDVVFLGAYRGASAAGLYEPVTAMVEWIPMVFTLAGSYLLPEVTAAVSRGDRSQISALYHATSRWGFAVASPFLGVVLVAPTAALGFLYGDAFDGFGGVARVLLIGSFIHVLLGFNGVVLEAYGRPRHLAARALMGLGVNVAACVFLIPRFGAYGAAWATSAAFIVVNAANSGFLYRKYRVTPWDGRFLWVVSAVGSAAGLASVLAPQIDPLLLRCVVTAALTGGAGVATTIAVAPPQERASMRRVLRIGASR